MIETAQIMASLRIVFDRINANLNLSIEGKKTNDSGFLQLVDFDNRNIAEMR